VLAIKSLTFTKFGSIQLGCGFKILIGLPDVGLFGSKETLGLLLSQGVVGSWIHSVLTVCPYTAC